MPTSDFPAPQPCQFVGSRLARLALRLGGWQVRCDGLPARQGVLVVYPHTSNWDFIVMMLAKWAIGLQVSFWGKDSLFTIPLFGRWLRWLGGIPVDRGAARGVVGQVVDALRRAKADDAFFWLGLAPEGTRQYRAGWRSGFYLTALQAAVPLGVVRLDYGRRQVLVLDFLRLTGDPAADMARIAGVYEGVRGARPAAASPVVLLEASPSRTDTIAP